MLRQLFAAGAIAASALAANIVHAAEAGRIILVAGAAQVAERAATLNAPVQEGELLVTGKDGYIYIKTADNGLFVLRPSSRARIVAYYIDKKNPANTRVKFELLSGVARSQSGEAVKLARQNFRFNTPVAAIGVRGTDFTVFTDQDTSRVTVHSGGITLSGFGNGCSPEGGGPCEGSAARELSAAQKGQLLQIRRGQAAPQLLQDSNSMPPDVIAPPRPDEPAKQAGGPSLQPSLDAHKTAVLQAVSNAGGGKSTNETPISTVPPVIENKPVTPPVPQVPEREIVWGRWQPVLGQPATVDTSAQILNNSQAIAHNTDFALYRTEGKEYRVPERGSVGFTLAKGEAYIHDPALPTVAATVENGVLNFNFDKRTYASSVDLVNSGTRTLLQSTGVVSIDGRFAGDSVSIAPNNMVVNGVLSAANGGTAAYLFQANLDKGRTVNGATYWNTAPGATK